MQGLVWEFYESILWPLCSSSKGVYCMACDLLGEEKSFWWKGPTLQLSLAKCLKAFHPGDLPTWPMVSTLLMPNCLLRSYLYSYSTL